MKPKKPNAPAKTRLPHETKGETKSARWMKGEQGEKAGGRIDRRRPAKKTHARSGNLPLSLLLPQRIEDPLGGRGFRPRSPLPLSLAEATDRAAVRPVPRLDRHFGLPTEERKAIRSFRRLPDFGAARIAGGLLSVRRGFTVTRKGLSGLPHGWRPGCGGKSVPDVPPFPDHSPRRDPYAR